METPGK